MKNIFGTTEKLKLKDENGVVRYRYNEDAQRTYDSNGNQLTFEDSDGYWCKSTYDSNSYLLTYKNSNGYWYEYTYDSSGNRLTSEYSDGIWHKSTYDSSGNELTYESSDGTRRGFDTKEYTMEELTKELGHNFKIKK
jgi:YD repeat-containing protein